MRTMQQQLIEKGLSEARMQEKDNQKAQTRKHPKERLSAWEWAEIMGSNRDTFRRVKGGAIRRNR
ncbi:hypothetical protein [Planococcus sp. YIM B11945]|uniref:hypothetical protein n=1 Tax=Planococcus sp. YIM B11945 TaxID=3435410 RepID=UPI003D7D8D61